MASGESGPRGPLEADVAGGGVPLISSGYKEDRLEDGVCRQPDVETASPSDVDDHTSGSDPMGERGSLLDENRELRHRLEELEKENCQIKQRLRGSGWGCRLGNAEGVGKLRHAPRDLYIVFSAKWAECTAYFGFSYIFVAFVSEEFNMTDREAGALYAWYGFLCTLFGLLGGFCIDYFGVRKSMLFGTMMATIGRGICFLTTETWWMQFATLFFLPLGAAFGVPVMAISVRRYTHSENRSYAFSYFYGVLNLGSICGVYLINTVRWNYPEGMVVAGADRSWMRLLVGASTVFTAYTVFAAYFVRDIRVDSERPLTDSAVHVFNYTPGPLMDRLRECAGTSKFWRLVIVTFIFCGVRMTFRHLDATFPKYFMRQYGRDSPFEMIVLINPVLAMLLSPMMTELLVRWKVPLSQVLIGGSLLSGTSAFALAVEDSPMAAVFFVVLLSVGESIWSPKLYEYSTMAAPDGREGMYVALTFAPVYLASFFTGFLSGWLLENFCSKSHPETRNTQLLWFLVGLSGMSAPVLLMILRRTLFRDEEDERASSARRIVHTDGNRLAIRSAEPASDDAE
eukprot:TRINITY_DN15074_c0_g1_i1.p1 TRINITY_DN15074_c0_g1~~TRINITY_DN15074_c0_g1_i1.p1  ORF type:complete len:569 (+),score=102.66 TRINITY_DN15074_c0_g1_i1:79-1785(+)